MKFAKELEQDLVPEWRIKYLDYKAGKKQVKAVARAVNRVNATPRTPADQRPSLPRHQSLYGATSPFVARTRPSPLWRFDGGHDGATESLHQSPAPLGADSRPESDDSAGSADDPAMPQTKKTPPMPIHGSKRPSGGPAYGDMKYGSFVPTPPKMNTSPFKLPDPAMSEDTPTDLPHPALPHPTSGGYVPPRTVRPNLETRMSAGRSASVAVPQNAYEVGPNLSPGHRNGTIASLRNRIDQARERPFVRRMFSVGTPLTPSESRRLDMDMVVVDQVRQRQKDFFAWMDQQLDKIETFYKSKEDEAGARLAILREQLHEMRNRRLEEVAVAQQAKAIRKEDERNIFDFQGGLNGQSKSKKSDDVRPTSRDKLKAWMDPIERVIGNAKAKAFAPRPGSNSKALQDMKASPALRAHAQAEQNRLADEGRDYIRRFHYSDEVPYRTAKRKLKLALQEFYRSMELLKSYALLNRTAFRKINKKYDKAVDARPPLRYMSEKVNKAWFVQSDVLDSHLHAVEDLYARYFERGNHKIAVGKLRSASGRPADRSSSAFVNGLLIGVGLVFSIQGVIYGAQLLYHKDPTIQTQTTYLLQIYAGYFLALYLFAWFCFGCSIWTQNKINYQFVFEFDPRHNLDWRQLSEFPSFLIFLFGIFIWINFSRYGSPEFFIYYPVILVFLTAVIIFFPGPLLFHRSRRWFVYSHWRLLLAGLYPVEFRDFFLGDMYCSLTYYMSNIELFFCLYAHYWSNPAQCNSQHSRLLGFFSTLPGIWRALQCIRRYYDTRNVFPHLVNCGKYTATIMYYATLSIYRIHQTRHMLALFVTFACINAVYVSIWDIVMDWSLLQPNASKRFLRDVRGYKVAWPYYLAMTLDPILRFNWIFYAIYTEDISHNSLVSFLVGFSEITRRGMWVLFRVENEHCANVARFKASRDVPLPYTIPTESEADFQRAQQELAPEGVPETTQPSPALSRLRSRTSGAALEAQQEESTTSSMRRRPSISIRTFTRILADAHTQDFEKKRKPGAGDSDSANNRRRDGEDEDTGLMQEGASSDEDEEEDEVDQMDILDAGELLRERRSGSQGEDQGRDS